MTSLNEELNIVIPIGNERDEAFIYAYHTPISHAVFQANYRTLSAAKSALSAKGLHYLMDSGPRIAGLTLRDEGLRDAVERGDLDNAGNVIDTRTPNLLGEIKRLTTVLVPDNGQWSMLPVDIAIQQGSLDEEEWSEVESSIVFFTFHYAMCKKASRPRIAQSTASVLRGSITSSSAMDFVASLPTLTRAATTAVRAESLVPS